MLSDHIKMIRNLEYVTNYYFVICIATNIIQASVVQYFYMSIGDLKFDR